MGESGRFKQGSRVQSARIPGGKAGDYKDTENHEAMIDDSVSAPKATAEYQAEQEEKLASDDNGVGLLREETKPDVFRESRGLESPKRKREKKKKRRSGMKAENCLVASEPTDSQNAPSPRLKARKNHKSNSRRDGSKKRKREKDEA